MSAEGHHHHGQVGVCRDGFARERRDELAEEPWPTEASAAHDHARAARLLHHRERVSRTEDVAVAEHREPLELLDKSRDSGPVGRPAVHLGGRAAMQCHPCDTGVTSNASGVQVGEVILVDPLAHLHGHRDAIRRSGNGSTHDVGEEVALPRQGTPASLARDLGHRAAEVEVHVVGEVLIDHHAHRFADDDGIDAVELDRAWRLVIVEAHHVEGGLVTLDQGT